MIGNLNMRNSSVNFVTHVTRRNFNHDGPEGLIKFSWNLEFCLSYGSLKCQIQSQFKFLFLSAPKVFQIFDSNLEDQVSPPFLKDVRQLVIISS